MPKSIDFPTYKKTLTSFERSILGNVGWACTWNTKDEDSKKFDEDFNHKNYDKLNIPRIIDQPVDFII
jgi:hypothetical protein